MIRPNCYVASIDLKFIIIQCQSLSLTRNILRFGGRMSFITTSVFQMEFPLVNLFIYLEFYVGGQRKPEHTVGKGSVL